MEKNPIDLIAEVLPQMMGALTEASKSDSIKEGTLGGITSQIAKYLNAEICSIFRINEKTNKLDLLDAHGYNKEIIGGRHELEKGLTGKIYKDQITLILNYCVQDSKLGWTGHFDKQLQSHCWSLLGVPIMNAQKKHCYGVIKFENKLTQWASNKDGKYLTEIIPFTSEKDDLKRICTPETIINQIEKSTGLNNTQKLLSLARELSSHVQEISFASNNSSSHVQKLSKERLVSHLNSIKWYIEVLHHEVDQAQKNVNDDHYDQIDVLQKLTHAFRLSLNIYEPFCLDDYLFAQALAQIVGIAFDASESAQVRGLQMVRHGIKNITGSFLGNVDQLYANSSTLQDFNKIKSELKFIYSSALDLTSSCSMAARQGSQGISSLSRFKFGVLYSSSLLHRLDYHYNFCKLNDVVFIYPELDAIELSIKESYVDTDIGLIAGVLDGLLVNSIKHAQCTEIRLEVKKEMMPKSIILSLADNGVGISRTRLQHILKGFSEMQFSEKGGFGLSAYRNALKEINCELSITTDSATGTKVNIMIPVFQENESNFL